MKIQRIVLSLLATIAIQSQLLAQDYVQTVKGFVYDADSRMPLPGATIVLKNSDPLIGTTTDLDGKFKIENVPVGRHNFEITFMGYENVLVSEVVVGSGKQVVLEIAMNEKSTSLKTIEVKANAGSGDAVNQMAVSGVKQIEMEQAGRYAGAADDPSRLASSFAGVASGLQSNGIVVRGNSPKGLLWRLEDVEIGNPNHFADLAVFGGGGLTALSSQMIARSDFFTGAFPAEYSNAISGVFDMKLRSGNTEKREYTMALGSNGIDVSSEGPFKNGKNATYLFNYRFSTLTLLQPILPPEAGRINYQDLCWKINLPTSKNGVWSFWGFAARDSQSHDAETDSTLRETDTDALQYGNILFTGATGINYRMQVNSKSYVSSVLSASGTSTSVEESKISDMNVLHNQNSISSLAYRLSFRSVFNHKYSARHTNRTGIGVTRNAYDILFKNAVNDTSAMSTLVDNSGDGWQTSLFTQSKLNFGENMSLVAGINAIYYGFNKEWVVEPRIGARLQVGSRTVFSLASGLHSRPEPLNVYLVDPTNTGSYPNRNLPVTKAVHLVAGFEYSISEHLQLKVEPYYQYLFDVPVSPSGSFSLINAESVWFISDSLCQRGTGHNTGIDFTLERKLAGSYYYLFTASVFDSRYKGGDKVLRNTRFNKNYVVNALFGYEWKTGRKNSNLFSLNFRLSMMGGDRLEVVDYPASLAASEVIYDDARAFENKKPDSQILSFSINYRINKPRHSSIWSVQMINVLGQKEFEGYEWDNTSSTVVAKQDPFFIPAISYKIEW